MNSGNPFDPPSSSLWEQMTAMWRSFFPGLADDVGRPESNPFDVRYTPPAAPRVARPLPPPARVQPRPQVTYLPPPAPMSAPQPMYTPPRAEVLPPWPYPATQILPPTVMLPQAQPGQTPPQVVVVYVNQPPAQPQPVQRTKDEDNAWAPILFLMLAIVVIIGSFLSLGGALLWFCFIALCWCALLGMLFSGLWIGLLGGLFVALILNAMFF